VTVTIIDCDPGIDDVAALILAAQAAELNVVAITTVAGNVGLATTTANALRTLDFLAWDIPVARGAARPLVSSGSLIGTVHAEEVHGVDGLGGVALPETTRPPAAETAWDLIYRTACEHPGELQILALGPLTNLAIAFIRYPDLMVKLKRIIAMGGAILAGNTTPAAEFNFYADPEAAARVLDSGVPVYLCPLDVTHQAYLTREELHQIAELGTPQARLFAELFTGNYDQMAAYADGKGTPLHDPTAVLYAIDPSEFTGRDCFIGVETAGSITRGKTVTDAYSDKQFIANNYLVETVDREKFVQRICDLLA